MMETVTDPRRCIVAGIWQNCDAGEIVRALAAKCGLTPRNIDPGVKIANFFANYITAAEALDRLAVLCDGFQWQAADPYLDFCKGEGMKMLQAFRGDGRQNSFVMPQGFTHQPTVFLNGIRQSVGIKFVDTGHAFYWAMGDPVLVADARLPILGQYDYLVVDG
jgi:hypothetical protein